MSIYIYLLQKKNVLAVENSYILLCLQLPVVFSSAEAGNKPYILLTSFRKLI